MAYATVADLKIRQRWPTIADLLADGRPGGVRPSEAELDDDPILAALLDQSAGRIKSALVTGGRYDADDLASLTGVDLQLLVGLNCDLCWSALLLRGGSPKASEEFGKAALETLGLLAKGINVFNLPAQVEAGKPDSTAPTAFQVINANALPNRTPNYFANPIQRLPLDQQR